jgi:hypothetical protein
MKRTIGYVLSLLFAVLLHVVFSSGQVAGQTGKLDGKAISQNHRGPRG